MIPMLIAKLIGFGVPPKAAKVVLFTLLAAVLVILMAGGKCAYDRSIISRHDDKVAAATAVADRKADEGAAVQRRADDTRLTNEQAQLEKVTTDEPNPLERRRSYFRCLGLQQAARANGQQSPTCT